MHRRRKISTDDDDAGGGDRGLDIPDAFMCIVVTVKYTQNLELETTQVIPIEFSDFRRY